MSTATAPQAQPESKPTQRSAKAIAFPYPMNFLKQHTIKDVLSIKASKEKPISITPDSTIEDALNCLATNNILYVLVRSSDTTKKNYTHFLSIFDILSGTIFQKFFETEKIKSKEKKEEAATSDVSSEQLTAEAQQVLTQKISTVLGLTAEDFAITKLPSSESVFKLCDVMKRGTHRVLIVDNENEDDTKVLTQFELVSWLEQNKESLDRDLLDTKADAVMQLAMQYKTDSDPNQPIHLPESRWSGSRMKFALHMPSTYSALLGFRTMQIHKMSGLALVDESGKLVGNLSVSDLRGLTHDNISLLSKPVLEYIASIKQHLSSRKEGKAKEEYAKTTGGLVKLAKSDGLGQAIESCIKENVHRCWVVDEEEKPVGVITLSDIISAVVPAQLAAEE